MTAPQKTNFARATIHGAFWRYAAFYSGKLMVFVSTIILARLLTKEEFGVVGYAVTVIGFLEGLSDLGIGPALIYHRDDPRAADTAFWLGLLISSILFGLTFLFGPLVGVFFNDPRAIPVTQILALTFPISALSDIHESLLRKQLAFGRNFIPSFVQALTKGVASIVFALLGFGPWSLIYGQLSGTAIAVIAYWLIFPWRPSFRIARDLTRSLLNYGLKIVSVDMLAIALLNIDYLLVGRYMGAAALGVYTLGFRIPELFILQFCNTISTVVFPVYSKMRDEPGALSRAFLTTMRYVALITIPIGLGLALVARPVVLTIFTRKWLEAADVIRTISIYALFLAVFAYNAGSVYKAQGRPEVLTKLALIRITILAPAMWWAVAKIGTLVAVGWTHIIVAFIGGMINLIVAARLLHISWRSVVATIAPAALAGGLMAVAVRITLTLTTLAPTWAQLTICVIVGAITYGAGLWWLQRDVMLNAGRTLRTALTRA
ncbi:MAG: lipopolysaccharide biosynthesis protein [Chloroflexi bacterium]|nr:lipopolysaccharide biosynthesis protein [Chloroflexota bacterium]